MINGISNAFNFNDLWLKYFDRNFYRKYKDVLDLKKGAGYWLWKPYIILKALLRIQSHDHLLYLDAGIEICAPINELIKLCGENEGILLFSSFGNKNKNWTKREAFIGMNCDEKEYHDAFQLEAGMMMLKNTSKNIQLIRDWLHFCTKFELISDPIHENPYSENFKAHRHDQSILTILAVKYGIPFYRSPHQYANSLKLPQFRVEGEYLDTRKDLPFHIRGRYAPAEEAIANSPYGTLFHHHRNRLYFGLKNKYKLPFTYLGMFIDAIRTEKWLKRSKSDG